MQLFAVAPKTTVELLLNNLRNEWPAIARTVAVPAYDVLATMHRVAHQSLAVSSTALGPSLICCGLAPVTRPACGLQVALIEPLPTIDQRDDVVDLGCCCTVALTPDLADGMPSKVP
jgi:hypothetical protein